MPRYEAFLRETEVYRVEVKADDEKDARRKAWKLLNVKGGREDYFDDSESDDDVAELGG